MSHVCIRFYVGHESKTAAAETIARAVLQLREDCATTWGGSTAVEGDGLFHGRTGFYRERCTIVETVAEANAHEPNETEEWARTVAGDMARDCARLAGQECIMVTVQPLEVDFVTP